MFMFRLSQSSRIAVDVSARTLTFYNGDTALATSTDAIGKSSSTTA